MLVNTVVCVYMRGSDREERSATDTGEVGWGFDEERGIRMRWDI